MNFYHGRQYATGVVYEVSKEELKGVESYFTAVKSKAKEEKTEKK